MTQNCITKEPTSIAAAAQPLPPTTNTKSNSESNSITGIVKQSFGFWRGSNNQSNNTNNSTNNTNAIKCNEQETAPIKGASMMLCPIPQPFRQQNNNSNWLTNNQQQKNSNNIKSSSINGCDYPNESNGGIFFIHQQNQHIKQHPTPLPPSLQNAINTNGHSNHNNHHHLQNNHQYQHQQNNHIPISAVNGHYYHSNNCKIPLGSTSGNQQQQQQTHQQNFHQISKTATNLLAEIYEKHFLNQTTFENVALLNAHSRNSGQIPLGLTVTKNSSSFITAMGNDDNNYHQSTIIHSMNHSTSNSGNLSRLASAATTTILDDEFSLSSLEHKQQTVRMHVSGYPQPQTLNQPSNAQHQQQQQQQQQQSTPQVINYEHQLQLQFEPQDQQLHASFRPPATINCSYQQQQPNHLQDNSQMCQRNLINQANHYPTQNATPISYPTHQQILQNRLAVNENNDLNDRSSSPYGHLYEVIPEHPPVQHPPLHPPQQQQHTRTSGTNRVLRKRSSSKSQRNQNKDSNKNSATNVPVDGSENKQNYLLNQKGKIITSGNDEHTFNNSNTTNGSLVQKPPPIPNLPPPPNIPPPDILSNVNNVTQSNTGMQMQRTNADGEHHPNKTQTTENYKNSIQFHSSHTKQPNQKEKQQKQPALVSSIQQQQQSKLQSSDVDNEKQKQKQKQQSNNHTISSGQEVSKVLNSSSSSSTNNSNNNKLKNDTGISNIRGTSNASNCTTATTTTTNKDNNSSSATIAILVNNSNNKNSKGNSDSTNICIPVVDGVNNNHNNSTIASKTNENKLTEFGKDHLHQQQNQHLIIQYAQQQQQQQQQQQLSAGIILSPDQHKIQLNNIVGPMIATGALTTTLIPSTATNLITVPNNYDEFNNMETYSTDTPNGIAKFFYRNSKIDLSEETAQVMAAAAYYATRAAAKFSQSGGGNSSGTSSKIRSDMTSSSRNGGFCGALQRAPPPMPPGLARRLANKENYGIGKVKVMLRVSDVNTDQETQHFMTVDKKKRQVTLTDPTTITNVTTIATQADRAPMVAAPKMFAFDNLFTADDQQSDVCSSALSEVIPAVLEGSDGCLLSIGYPNTGQSRTMLGAVNSSTELGAIPCAISWLYKGINERRQKSGSRFSVRVSALGISATKPDSSSKDLLAAHATESDDSPGVYLRDDFLGGPTELRAPTAERAALFLDAALAGRPQSGLEPAMIFTLHVYQYSLSRKGGVAGGRSRLHLIDLGGCANRNGGLPLSGIGNILLAILSGQRHPPNKDHPMTPLLKDCLAPLTCHVSILAHVSHTQTHADALTTIQLASRIHRMRRRKHRFPISSDKTIGVNNTAHQSGGSSEGPDPSSSDLSADTVIYMGPCDDATDGEHPPVYLPSLGSGDNRCAMNKALKGSSVEKQTKIPSVKKSQTQKPQSPVVTNRTNSLKRINNVPSPTQQQQQQQQNSNITNPQGPLDHMTIFSSTSSAAHNSPIKMASSISTTKIVAGALRHTVGTGNNTVNTIIGGCNLVNKGSNSSTPKGSPLRRPVCGVGSNTSTNVATSTGVNNVINPESPLRQISEEQWIDGPRLSRAKVAEARHLLREINHVKQCETWVDGPKSATSSIAQLNATTPITLNQHQQQQQQAQQQLHQQILPQSPVAKPLVIGNLPVPLSQTAQGYGFMDSHKKIMIRQWVENQSSHVFQRGTSVSANSSPTHSTSQTAMTAQQLAQHQQNLQAQQQQIQQQLRTLSYQISQYNSAAAMTTTSNCASPNRQLDLKTEEEQLLSRLENNNSTEMVNAIGDGLTSLIASGVAIENSIRIGLKVTGNSNSSTLQNADDTDLISEKSCHNIHQTNNAGDNHTGSGKEDDQEDQDSGPSEVPPALPLITPLGSREISHESLHRIISRHVSRESLAMQQQMAAMNSAMMDCGLQVTEDEIARAMSTNGEHPLAALSNGDISVVSSFNIGDAFSDCAMGERTRNQFDQLARLREIFTSQLAMAEVTPNFRMHEANSVYSEPAFRFNTGPGSVCSEPPYRPSSPRCGSCRQSLNASRTPSQTSLPSLNGIMTIAGMEQYASLRHPDGASDPNLQNKTEQNSRQQQQNHHQSNDLDDDDELNNEKSVLLGTSTTSSLKHHQQQQQQQQQQRPSPFEPDEKSLLCDLPIVSQNQLPLLPLNTSSETAYDSGHDSSTPRTSKHSGISRRAESGYHSVATARDSDESSFTSGSMVTKEQQLLQHHHLHHQQQHLHHQHMQQQHQQHNKITIKKKRQDKSLCNWLRNPFTCTYPETEGEISDF
ncbi:uncharacterized protein LOC129616484 [Condylostylus longicornis]|uniref:uncharacterized protein LOC129616484 n=1 Tax=Condylostylus longicornis TaxID=2530218 RepID=UPI00244DB98F|nr:uncharacterized protein LOC129616484 [Condylostylus longicornis]